MADKGTEANSEILAAPVGGSVSDFLALMKRKHDVGPARTGQNAVRASGLTFDLPAKASNAFKTTRALAEGQWLMPRP